MNEPCATAAAWRVAAEDAVTTGRRRAGRAQRLVLEALAAAPCCVSAHELVTGLRDRGTPVGVASAYRVLEQLDRAELLRRIDAGGVAHFEPALAPAHHHLVCNVCGAIVPIDPAVAAPLLAGLEGLEVEGVDLLVRGRCRACLGRAA